ncbi:MAG TPA: glycerol kinase GlpK [Candidatus Eisenbacteria bacterium]|nr:glycerol kinase GlpK [Candidatus Eisenbacteria bacterium]
MKILAIDQGTTGTTALLLDGRGRVTGRGYAELPQHFPRPGWVEHDGREIWTTTLRAVRGALAAAGRAARGAARPDAIGITSQRETTLLWDRATGRPLAPGIVWQDRRTADRCAALRRAGAEPAIARATGLRLDPYFSATKLEWLLRSVPNARRRAAAGALAFGTVDAWLVWNLTGGAVHATDPTNASRTLLYHLRRHRWDDALLDRFGVPRALLPEVRPSAGDFGVTRGVPGLPDGIPIRGIAGDQQAALFGQGCVTAGGMKNTYGTGCFLMLHTGKRPVVSRAGLLTTVACGPRGEIAYALEGSVFVAGAAVQWLRDGLGVLADAAESERIARSVPDAGGTHLVPAFAGLGAPHWRPDVRGLWCGLTRGTTRAHLVRAALESIAHQSRDLVEAMRRESGARVRSLLVDGGATRNDFLMQFQADLLGVPVERPAMVESTALGAAILAGIGAGVWSRREEAPAAVGKATRFRPRMSASRRAALVKDWRAAVSLLTKS